jgi:DNA-binding LacI/PurR family transcriptional regulator
MSPDDIERFKRFGVPVVFLNRQAAATGVDCISTDNDAAARNMADALHRAGHRRYLCVAGPEGAPVSESRLNAFAKQARELGATQLDIVYTDFSYEQGSAAIVERAAQVRRDVDAIFCANDQLAFGVMDACRYRLALDVPKDISVVGFDDVTEASRPAYRLTTVRQQTAMLAEKALDLLMSRRLKPGTRARIVMVPGEIIRRESARLVAE